jgi:hypothetical protein
MSPWAATTKYNRVGGLNSRHLFLKVLEAEVQDQGAGRSKVWFSGL